MSRRRIGQGKIVVDSARFQTLPESMRLSLPEAITQEQSWWYLAMGTQILSMTVLIWLCGVPWVREMEKNPLAEIDSFSWHI